MAQVAVGTPAREADRGQRHHYGFGPTKWLTLLFVPTPPPRAETGLARPACKGFVSHGLSNLRKRIRPFSGAVGQDGDRRVLILIRGRRRAPFPPRISEHRLIVRPSSSHHTQTVLDHALQRRSVQFDARALLCFEGLPAAQQHPNDTRHLGGQSHDDDITVRSHRGAREATGPVSYRPCSASASRPERLWIASFADTCFNESICREASVCRRSLPSEVQVHAKRPDHALSQKSGRRRRRQREPYVQSPNTRNCQKAAGRAIAVRLRGKVWVKLRDPLIERYPPFAHIHDRSIDARGLSRSRSAQKFSQPSCKPSST